MLFLSDILPTAFEVGVLNGGVQPGDTVAVVGAGPVGLAAIMTAQLYTPGQIIAIDLSDARLEKAREFGADVTINNGREDALALVMELTGGLGADVAIEAVGVPETFELCTELVRPGGRIANVGVHGHSATLHLETLWTRDVTITTGLVDTFTVPQLLKLVAQGRLDPTPFVTHRFPLGETMAGYDAFAAAAETHALKVVLEAEPVASSPEVSGRDAAGGCLMTTTQLATVPEQHGNSSPERTSGLREIAVLDLAEVRPRWPARVGAMGSGDDRMEVLRAGSAQALTGEDVLAFLQRLRLDRNRSRALNSGRSLLLAAAESGLVALRELDAFVGLMVELRRAGLVDWRCAPGDIRGDDLPHAAEFHLTSRGRGRLSDSGGLAARSSAPAHPVADRGPIRSGSVVPRSESPRQPAARSAPEPDSGGSPRRETR